MNKYVSDKYSIAGLRRSMTTAGTLLRFLILITGSLSVTAATAQAQNDKDDLFLFPPNTPSR